MNQPFRLLPPAPHFSCRRKYQGGARRTGAPRLYRLLQRIQICLPRSLSPPLFEGTGVERLPSSSIVGKQTAVRRELRQSCLVGQRVEQGRGSSIGSEQSRLQGGGGH